MKIVINKCFGGFSLSHEGVMEYARRKKIKLYATVDVRKPDGSLDFRKYAPYTGGDAFIIYYSTKPLNPDGTHDDDAYFSNRDMPRDDKDLVATVKALGEKANGSHAELKIVNVPKGVKWGIHEYDGMEHVEENHRTWG